MAYSSSTRRLDGLKPTRLGYYLFQIGTSQIWGGYRRKENSSREWDIVEIRELEHETGTTVRIGTLDNDSKNENGTRNDVDLFDTLNDSGKML